MRSRGWGAVRVDVEFIDYSDLSPSRIPYKVRNAKSAPSDYSDAKLSCLICIFVVRCSPEGCLIL